MGLVSYLDLQQTLYKHPYMYLCNLAHNHSPLVRYSRLHFLVSVQLTKINAGHPSFLNTAGIFCYPFSFQFLSISTLLLKTTQPHSFPSEYNILFTISCPNKNSLPRKLTWRWRRQIFRLLDLDILIMFAEKQNFGKTLSLTHLNLSLLHPLNSKCSPHHPAPSICSCSSDVDQVLCL